jgi:hypothetical protein
MGTGYWPRKIVLSIGPSIGGFVRDVYMEFDGPQSARTFSLYAVITEDADPDLVREWLAEGALEVSPDLGIPARLEVGTARQVSLALVESAYCADLSQITWAANPSPEGAI